MMKTVWKFQFSLTSQEGIEMPEGAIIFPIMQVGSLNKIVSIWAEVNPSAPMVHRNIRIHGTGHKIRDEEKYITTVIDPPFVWHLYEG
jgi:hypothetical protein